MATVYVDVCVYVPCACEYTQEHLLLMESYREFPSLQLCTYVGVDLSCFTSEKL